MLTVVFSHVCSKWSQGLALCLACLAAGCSMPQEDMTRPTNVPIGAVAVRGGKSHWWIECERNRISNHCRVFNAGGDVLYDEAFNPADGGAPLEDDEIEVEHRGTAPGRIFMKNGRVLLVGSRFASEKDLLDLSLASPQ